MSKKLSWLTMIAACVLVKAVDAGNVQTVINNTTGYPDSHVWVLVVGQEVGLCPFYFVDYSNGVPTLTLVTSSTQLSQCHSLPLSYFPGTENHRTLQLPEIRGRIYFSIQYPMQLSVTQAVSGACSGSFTVNDAVVTPPTSSTDLYDPNYFVLFDKVEFNNEPSGNFVANPTAVDFFSLPIQLQFTSCTTNPPLLQSGWEPTQGRAMAFVNIARGLQGQFPSGNLPPVDSRWVQLILKDQYPGTSAPEKNVPLRVLSAKDGNTIIGEDYVNNYTNAVWSFYMGSTSSVNIDASEIAQGNFINTMAVVGSVWDFTNGMTTINANRPCSSGVGCTSVVFGGDVNANFITQGEANMTAGAVVGRDLRCALDAGLLGHASLPTGSELLLSNTSPNNVYTNYSSLYYTGPDSAPTGGGANTPWYDLYAKTMHTYSVGNDSTPYPANRSHQIYAFSFDDFLGQDGTMTNSNGGTDPDFRFTLTLGNLGGTPIPDPFDQETTPTAYTVRVHVPNAMACMDNFDCIQYRRADQGATTFSTFVPDTMGGNVQTFSNVTSTLEEPFQLLVVDLAGNPRLLSFFFKAKTLLPITADLGITMEVNGNVVDITFGALIRQCAPCATAGCNGMPPVCCDSACCTNFVPTVPYFIPPIPQYIGPIPPTPPGPTPPPNFCSNGGGPEDEVFSPTCRELQYLEILRTSREILNQNPLQ